VTPEQPDQAKILEGATMPDGIKYTTQEPESEPTPAETGTDNAEGQPDQWGDLNADQEVIE
jgi:hypothetical protein